MEIFLVAIALVIIGCTQAIRGSLKEIDRKLGVLIDLSERAIPPKHN